MPANDLLRAQLRTYEIGIIRTGVQVLTGKTRRDGTPATRPETINTFRLTSASRHAIEAAAGALGGQARPWDNRGHKEFEVITDAAELFVSLPPDPEAITMWYEMWSAAGCLRRCTSEINIKTGKPCECAPLLERFTTDEDKAKERARLSKLTPQKACALQTRASFILADLPDVGTWRLNTKSYYGTVGLLGKIRIMEMARQQGIYLPARLWIDHQVDVTDGQTRHYPVPQVSFLNTIREIASGELAAGGLAAQLPPPPGEQRAITAGQAPATAPAQAPATAPAQVPAQAQRAPAPKTAQEIADRAVEDRTRARIRTRFREADSLGVKDDLVCINTELDEWMQLGDRLTALAEALPDDRRPDKDTPAAEPAPAPEPAAAEAPAAPAPDASTGDGGLWPAEPAEWPADTPDEDTP